MQAIDFQNKLLGLTSKLQSFAYSLTLNREDARDLFQDTFLRALTYKEKFIDKTNFKAWVFTIMKNIFINNYRRNVRVQRVMDEKDVHDIPRLPGTDTDNPEKILQMKQVREKIDSLSDDFKTPLMMHQQGYKYHEISEKMHIPIGTVKSRIYFAKEKLSKLLR